MMKLSFDLNRSMQRSSVTRHETDTRPEHTKKSNRNHDEIVIVSPAKGAEIPPLSWICASAVARV